MNKSYDWWDANPNSRQWRRENVGCYLVTDRQGNVLSCRLHRSIPEKIKAANRVAHEIEPGTLWTWAESREIAMEQIQFQVDRQQVIGDCA